jgi:hypothetical protein
LTYSIDPQGLAKLFPLTPEQLIETRVLLDRTVKKLSPALSSVLDLTQASFSDEVIQSIAPHKLAWLTSGTCRVCGEKAVFQRYSIDPRVVDRCGDEVLSPSLGGLNVEGPFEYSPTLGITRVT